MIETRNTLFRSRIGPDVRMQASRQTGRQTKVAVMQQRRPGLDDCIATDTYDLSQAHQLRPVVSAGQKQTSGVSIGELSSTQHVTRMTDNFALLLLLVLVLADVWRRAEAGTAVLSTRSLGVSRVSQSGRDPYLCRLVLTLALVLAVRTGFPMFSCQRWGVCLLTRTSYS